MRIRRYAARLLSASSGSAATANPAASPPPPHAPWLHHAAADDYCDFCELGRPGPAPQEPADGIKHKGRIAGPVPEPDFKNAERLGVAQGQPAPEVKNYKIDYGPPVNEIAVGLGDTRGGSAVSKAAVEPAGTGEGTLVSEADPEPAGQAGHFVVNEQEVKCRASLVSAAAAKPEVIGAKSLENGSTTELEVLEGASVANEAAAYETVSPECKAATVPGVTGIMPKLTRGPSLVSEASTLPDCAETVSLVSKAVADSGAVGPEVSEGASLVHEAAELGSTGVGYIASDPAPEPEDTGGASCNVDNDIIIHESMQQPDCKQKIGNAVVRNAAEAADNAVQPFRCDAADVEISGNPTSNGTVKAKDLTVEGRVPHDRSVTPSVSCIVDIVARSIGRSERTDVICYARRRGKRKLELSEVKTQITELDDGVICEEETLQRTGPCESIMSTAGSADVKLADIKRELMDNSATRKVKKMKVNRFQCDIDYCRMTFKTKSELSVHKKNICTFKSCDRHFRSHRYLKRHQSVHNNDTPYKCPWEGCNMAFKWSWDRTQHFQVHAGEKPYKCTVSGCSRIFKYVSDFIRHRRRCKPQR